MANNKPQHKLSKAVGLLSETVVELHEDLDNLVERSTAMQDAVHRYLIQSGMGGESAAMDLELQLVKLRETLKTIGSKYQFKVTSDIFTRISHEQHFQPASSRSDANSGSD